MSPGEMSSTKDELPSVPKLEADGTNWVTFKTRLDWALADKEVNGHLNGSAPKPESKPGDVKPPDFDDKLAEWEKHERKARNLLAQRIPDSTLRKILHKKTVAEMWKTISTDFESKTSLVQSDLRAQFQSIRCPERGDLRAHLDKMAKMWEDISSSGVVISDEEHASIITNSLPTSYSAYVSHLSAAAHLLNKKLDTEMLTAYLLQEHDRQRLPRGDKSKDKSKDVALSAFQDNKKGRGKDVKGDKTKPKGLCWNCGGKGHTQNQCPSPKQDDKKDTKGKEAKDGKDGKDAKDAKTSTTKPKTPTADAANASVDSDNV
jgi:hypothetical protein